MKRVLIVGLFLVATVFAETETETTTEAGTETETEIEAESEFMNNIANKAEECAEELGYDAVNIDRWKEGSAVEDEEEKLTCLFACIMKKIGFIEDNNVSISKIIEEVNKSDLNEEKKKMLNDNINACKESVTTDSNDCKQAGQLMACLLSKAKADDSSSSEEKAD